MNRQFPLRYAAIGTIAGTLVACGWWIFLDGILQSQDAFPALHLIPGLILSGAIVFLNFVDINTINRPDIGMQVKVWIFLWLTIACLGIAQSIYITATEYPPDENWPGVAIILQTLLMFMGGLLFFVGRKK